MSISPVEKAVFGCLVHEMTRELVGRGEDTSHSLRLESQPGRIPTNVEDNHDRASQFTQANEGEDRVVLEQ